MKTYDHAQDQIFMKRALELAARGLGTVSPNPMVGSVIVHDGRIIGEGWHQKYGDHHAEVNAVNAVEDKSLLKDSTIYVSLEPCNHSGKTPPCTDLLLKHQLKRAVIANMDPNQVATGGTTRLRNAGVNVITGILEKEGAHLNKRFFTFIKKQRPYIILKWAETADGFIAQKNNDSKWISNELSRQLVHKWRSEEDAVLVGTKTALHDNPQLDVRDWSGRNPVRVVIDRFLKLDDGLNLFDKTQQTIVYNVLRNEENDWFVLSAIGEENFLGDMMRDLAKRNIQSTIVEGGLQTLQHFIDKGLWDEARVFKAQRTFSIGTEAPKFRGNLIHSESVLNDTLSIYTPRDDKS
jgi:diaminohydroxyphosphoribosylaminopyrimidine deaminase/5-amino-6-(5-phosphoribosylamino)uracil reductase